ncbi:MAG: Maf family protein [Phycisphaerae bacterium]
MKPIILASASPRRAELLTRARIPFEVRVSPAREPEEKPPLIPTDLWPACLAYMKAVAVRKEIENRKSKFENPLILAADTIVVHGHRILNKAEDRAHARRILSSLSGKTHQVITGICLLRGDTVRLSRAIATCRFKKLSSAQLAAYLDSELWKGKAGAYGIQDDHHDPFVTLVDGDITTVIGLPIPLVKSELASFAKE